jgi:hypothetical protein
MNETKVVTGKVRLSYAHVFEAVAINGEGLPKFSASLLIPKKDKKTTKAIEAAIEAAKLQGESKKWGGPVKASKLKMPLRDGDEDKDEDENYTGCFFVNAISKSRPAVVDEDLNHITDQSEVYSGCFVRAEINFYPFDFNGKKGIACGLNCIQKLDDGDALGGGKSNPEEAFKDSNYSDAWEDEMFS